MEDIVVAAIQMNAPCGRVQDNIERHRHLARKAVDKGAELVCFPELSITGHYADKAVWRCAEAVPGGSSCTALEKLASELHVVISAGVAELEDNVCYNTQFLAGPDGFIGKYRKSHASRDEYFYFRMGASFPVWDIGKCRLGIMICYDIAFPEVSRILALNGAEVIHAPHASRCGRTKPAQERNKVADQVDFFEHCGWARSRDNGVFMIMNNQVGDAAEHLDLDIVHAGGVVITDPFGGVVARSRARRFREETMVATLKAEVFTDNHATRCHYMQTRRPEIYGRIVETT